MQEKLKKIINKCGCVDIKIVVLLFFILIAIYSLWGASIKDEDCQCGN